MVVLDTLRKQRNVSDYDGDPISPALVEECLKQANNLLQRVKSWLAQNRPELA